MESLTDLWRAVLDFVRDTLDVARHNLMLGAISLGLAVAVWFLVNSAQNPPKTDFFSGMIPVQAVNVPQDRASLSEAVQVRVKITADKDVWDNLSISDFKATVDLSGMQPQQLQATLPVNVGVTRGDVKVVEVNPSAVDITLEPMTTRTVAVKAHQVGTIPFGFDVTDMKVSPETVQVSGAASLVNSVEAVYADVNLTGLQVSQDHDFSLIARDAVGGDKDVHIVPSTAKVSVTIIRKDTELVFPVTPSISGNAAAGYRASAVEVDPSFVKVHGPIEVLQSISTLPTDTITVDGAQSDVQRSVKLRLPQGAAVDGSDEVIVRVRVVPAVGQRNFVIAVQAQGLKGGLSVSLAPDRVTVAVAGLLPALDALAGDAITARLDLTNLGPGVYQLAPNITLPAGLQLVGSDPPNIVVTIVAQ